MNGGRLRWFALALAVTARGGAQAVAFQVPAECGSEAEFRERLTALAGRDAAGAPPSTLVIAPEASGGFRLTLGLGGETRELVHPDCRVLFRSALVIAATAANPDLELEDVEASGEPTPPAPALPAQHAAPTVTPVPAPVEATSRASRGPELRGSLALGAGLGLGVVPQAAPVFELRVAAHLGVFGASLSGLYAPPGTATSEGRSVEVQAVGARLAGRVTPHRLLALSLGVEADWLRGEGRSGIASPTEDSAWTVAPLAEVALVPWQNRYLSIEIGALGRVALQRPVFEVTGYGTVYEVPRFGFVGSARAAWHFP